MWFWKKAEENAGSSWRGTWLKQKESMRDTYKPPRNKNMRGTKMGVQIRISWRRWSLSYRAQPSPRTWSRVNYWGGQSSNYQINATWNQEHWVCTRLGKAPVPKVWKHIDFGPKQTWFPFYLCHLLAMWSWARCLLLLEHNFQIIKQG